MTSVVNIWSVSTLKCTDDATQCPQKNPTTTVFDVDRHSGTTATAVNSTVEDPVSGGDAAPVADAAVLMVEAMSAAVVAGSANHCC